MQFIHLISIVAGLLASTEALTTGRALAKPHIAPRALHNRLKVAPQSLSKVAATPAASSQIKDMILSQIITRAAADNTTTATDDSISFIFADANTNTSAACTDDFQLLANGTTEFPTGWVACNNNQQLMDDFYWQFTSYDNITSFSLELMHGFVNTQNYGEVLTSQNVTISLQCADVNHVDGCYLAQGLDPLHVQVATAIA